jgi:endonuclease/exonuclease/phosphatase family metal-dependent hydrolase
MAIRLCTYNIEWFDHLFNSSNSLKTGQDAVSRFNALATVLNQIDADLIGIVEAPNSTASGAQSTVTKIENFASQYGLRTTKAKTGYISGGEQEIAVLYDPAVLTVSHAPGGSTNSKSNPRFDGEFHCDTDDDRIKEIYKHYRPPLEAKVKVKASGKEFRLIEAHTKSKGIFSSVDMVHLERESRRNRLKIFAECQWIRRRVDEWLDKGHNVVVMGDINDGPGMDEYEMRYGRSGVEIIMGSIFEPGRILRNHAGRPKWGPYGWSPSTVRFKDRITETNINVLIDHILTSPGLKTSGQNPYQIWNPYENDKAKPLKTELLDASDHFPVSINLNP